VGRVGDRAPRGESLPRRRRAGHRADAPLRIAGPDPAGTRGLGRRDRDDPRRRPRRSPGRSPGAEGRRAGQPVRPREISCTRTRRAAVRAVQAGRARYQALTRENAEHRVTVDRNRHRARKSKSPSAFGHATAKDIRTRIAPAVITMANSPA
jgi:hypothetical protein